MRFNFYLIYIDYYNLRKTVTLIEISNKKNLVELIKNQL